MLQFHHLTLLKMLVLDLDPKIAESVLNDFFFYLYHPLRVLVLCNYNHKTLEYVRLLNSNVIFTYII